MLLNDASCISVSLLDQRRTGRAYPVRVSSLASYDQLNLAFMQIYMDTNTTQSIPSS